MDGAAGRQQQARKLGVLFILYLLLCSTAQAKEILWTKNLLSNPGAEAGTLTGWVTDDPVIVQASRSQETSSGIVAPFSGAWFFNMASAPAAPSGVSITKRLYQEIDLSTYGTAIDNSQVFAAGSTYFQTEDRPRLEGSDYAWLVLHFIDSAGATINSWTARLQSPNLAWVQAHLEGDVPLGTRRIGFELLGEKFESEFVNSFFDNAKLRIGVERKKIAIDVISGNGRVNPSSRGHVWVAILSDTEDLFDPAQVDISTVRFGSDRAESTRFRVMDINQDGIGDLLLRFETAHAGVACDDTDVPLIGETYDGQGFSGADSITTVCRR